MSWRKNRKRGWGVRLALTVGERRGRREAKDWKKIEGIGWSF